MAIDRNVVTQPGAAPVLVWATDTFHNCTYLNDFYQEFAGLPLSELLGENWTKIVHPNDLPQLLEISSEAFQQRRPFSLEARFRRHDGIYRWYLNVGYPRHTDDGAFAGYSGTNFDITETKHALQAREQEQNQFRSILKHSSTLIALIDGDFNYQYANEHYANYWGTTPEEIVGKNVKQIVDPETLVLAKKSLALIRNGVPVEFEHDRVKNGISQTLRVKFVPTVDSTGKVCNFHLFADDITELREKQRHFELILNHLPARVAYYDCNLNLQYANQTFYMAFDRQPANTIGKPLADILTAEALQAALPQCRRALNGESVVYENRISHNDKYKDVLVSLVPDLNAEGKTSGIYSLVLDISALKQAQAKLRRSERRFELALQGSEVGFWETAPSDSDYLFTENIETLLGLGKGKLNNSRQSLSHRIHPDDVERVFEIDSRLMLETGPHVVEFRLLTGKDEYKWFRSVGETERDSDGRIVHAAGTIANIDKLKAAELNAAQQVHNRDVFLSMLSHELRNPLAAIRFAVDFCLDSGTLDPAHQPMFEIIARQTDQTSRMLSDLLDVTRILGNRLLFHKASVDLSGLLNSSMDSIRHKFLAKQQKLVVDIDEKLVTFGDEVRLHQAFTNLLDNASKYTPDSGTIRLSAKRTSRPEESHAPDAVLATEQDDILIEISDNGYGIAVADQKSIFEIFFQEERSLHRSSGGLGLGLFLVREVILAHAGTLTANSDGVGLGSQFRVQLQSSPALAKKIPPPALGKSPKTFNLAIVEDNRDSRIALAHSLAARGWSVMSLSDGEQASKKIPKLLPEVAVIDIGLPGKNGLQLAQEFRNQHELNDMLLIALTGYGQPSDQQEIENAGFDGHLIKPIKIKQLVKMIERLKSTQQNTPEQPS